MRFVLFMRFKEIIKESYQFAAEEAAKQFNTKIDSYLGSGEFGEAYLTIDDKVIKITPSESEASFAKEISGKQIPHIVNIYNVIQLNNNLYAIYQEYLNTEDQSIEYHFHQALELFDMYSSDFQHFDIDDVEDPESIDPGLVKFIDEIGWAITMAQRNGIQYPDIHDENIGKRGNEYVIFDVQEKH